MSITPLSRSYNTNWLNLQNKHCNVISNSNYATLLIGDSLIAGLSRYPNIWRRYFKPLNAINCRIGGDRIQNVLWRNNNLPLSPSFQNAVILYAINNKQRDSSEDIADVILKIALTLRRKYNHLSIVACGLLPRDENWSVNRTYIKEVIDFLSYKCDLDGVNYIKSNDWTLHNGSLKANLFYFDNLHLNKDGNAKLSELIVNVIKPNSKTTEKVSMSPKLFNGTADFKFNDKDFPPLPCSMTVYASFRSSKPAVPVMFVQVNLFVPVMFVQVNLFVLVMFVQINLFVPVIFIQVNLFILLMFVQVNLFVQVLFVQENLSVLVMFVQVNLFALVMFV